MEPERVVEREPEPRVVAAAPGDLAWTEWAGLVWAVLWRNVATSAATFLAAMLLAVVAGVAVGVGASVGGGSVSASRGVIKAVSVLVGVASGVFFYYVWLRWLLASRLGSFRLVLVREGEGGRR